MKIQLAEPDGPYSAKIDTEVMETTITDAFIGPLFRTVDGEELAVVMRDRGFEFNYRGGSDEEWQHWSAKNGFVGPLSLPDGKGE